MNPQYPNQGGVQGTNDVSGELLPIVGATSESSPIRSASELESAAPEHLQTGGPQGSGTVSPLQDVAALAAPGQQMPASSVPAATSHIAAPATADDADLIEKEWVLRAKALVAKTKDDPHQQNKELNLYKADYIKKRYNKDVKVSEA